ncbi:hypothetical protein SprV_0200889400 [Sparganum proliferum]
MEGRLSSSKRQPNKSLDPVSTSFSSESRKPEQIGVPSLRVPHMAWYLIQRPLGLIQVGLRSHDRLAWRTEVKTGAAVYGDSRIAAAKAQSLQDSGPFDARHQRSIPHHIDSHDIHPLPSKVAVIRDFPPPTSKCQLQCLAGVVNFYHRLLPKCADSILLLTSLLSGSKPTFELKPAVCASFEQVKFLLADSTLLTRLHTDTPICLMVNVPSVAIDFTSDIRRINGSQSEVTDALSRPSTAHLQLSQESTPQMVAEQRRVGSPRDEDASGLQLQGLPLPPHLIIHWGRKVFSSLHNLSHPGSRATNKLVSDHFVWPQVYKEQKACFDCQGSRIQLQNKAPDSTFPSSGARLSHVH